MRAEATGARVMASRKLPSMTPAPRRAHRDPGDGHRRGGPAARGLRGDSGFSVKAKTNERGRGETRNRGPPETLRLQRGERDSRPTEGAGGPSSEAEARSSRARRADAWAGEARWSRRGRPAEGRPGTRGLRA